MVSLTLLFGKVWAMGSEVERFFPPALFVPELTPAPATYLVHLPQDNHYARQS